MLLCFLSRMPLKTKKHIAEKVLLTIFADLCTTVYEFIYFLWLKAFLDVTFTIGYPKVDHIFSEKDIIVIFMIGTLFLLCIRPYRKHGTKTRNIAEFYTWMNWRTRWKQEISSRAVHIFSMTRNRAKIYFYLFMFWSTKKVMSSLTCRRMLKSEISEDNLRRP